MKLATIETISVIESIPNFDRIELATVAGYQVVIPKSVYNVGDLVIYVATDTVLPDKPEFETYRKYAKKRVKTARIGNKELGFVWSQGLVLPINDYLPNTNNKIGNEVSELLGITKYEEPIIQQLDAKGKLPFNIPKTDEERYQNIKLDYNEICDVTLKIDGTSFTVYYDLATDSFGVCGRTIEYKLDCVNNYTQMVKKYNLDKVLPDYCKLHNVSLALRGEMYGNGIQGSKNNPHTKLPLNVAFYSVYNLTTGKYEYSYDDYYFLNVCSDLNLPQVHLLNYNVKLSYELLKHYEEVETINNERFEGVVIKTPTTSFKVINKFYDMNK